MTRLRDRRPGSTRTSLFCYAVGRKLSRTFCAVFYSMRCRGHEKVPATGAALIAANHQSFLDPPAIGSNVRHRQLDFLAKSGLFGFKPFGWLIHNLHSIPVRQGEPDATAMREVLKRLQRGSVTMIFPEGGRTEDGGMLPFSRGVAVLVKRAKCPVIPAAIDGAFEAWPRSRKLPKLFGCKLEVRYGDPIPHDELLADGPDAALRRLEREIDALRLECRAALRKRTKGRFPPKGPGDRPAFATSGDAASEPAAQEA